MKYLSLQIPGGQSIEAPSGIPTGGVDILGKMLRNSFSILIILCIVLAIVFIVLGGMQWITSGGDKTKIQAARAKLTWAVIGLIIGFAAFFIIAMIGYFFQVELLSF